MGATYVCEWFLFVALLLQIQGNKHRDTMRLKYEKSVLSHLERLARKY